MSIRSKLRPVGRGRWALLAVVVLVLAGAGAWFTMAGGEDDGTQRITSTVARGTYRTTVSASGTIIPKRDQDLSFSSAGTVTAVAVEVGDRVQRGDVLARIGDEALIAQRDAAGSQVDAARSQLAEDSGSSSTQVAASRAALAAAESQLAEAEEALAAASLRAPFDGTVSVVGYAVGDQVGGSTQTDPNGSDATPAVTVISPRTLLVEANVSANDVSRLKQGMQAEITPTGGGEAVYGTVEEVGVIAGASDSGAAQFPVTIAVTGTPSGLYPGSGATVAITVEQATDVLAVPTAALRSSGEETYVYVVEDGERVKTPVEIGQAYGAQTEVTSGVKEGDVVEVVTITGPRGNGDSGDRPQGDLVLPGGQMPGGGNVTVPGGQGPTFRSAG